MRSRFLFTPIVLGALLSSLQAQVPVGWVDKPQLKISQDFGMVYDAARECLVLRDQDRNETWEWYGQGWERQAQGAFPAGGGLGPMAMTYDLARRRSVLVDAGGGTWNWDGEAWTQIPGAQGIGQRWGTDLAYDEVRGRVVLYGGVLGLTTQGDTWEFDGITWTQVLPAQSPPPLQEHSLSYDAGRQRVVLFGGKGFGGTPFVDETWEYDGTTWVRRHPAHTPPTNWFQDMVYDRGRAVTVLCSAGETWEWDGVDWTQAQTATPATDWYVEMAYDERRGESFLIGFGSGGVQGGGIQTWSWDGSRWLLRDQTAAIEYSQPGLSADPSRRTLVAFGGTIAGWLGTGDSNDTWEWNGGAWEIRQPATRPPHRHAPSMFFDTVGRRTLMYGGVQYSAFPPNDLWSWDGVDWIQVPSSNSPPPLYDTAVAWDVARSRALLFGGAIPGPVPLPLFGFPTDQTWEWDGVDWTQRFPATVPPARTSHAMAYDATRGRMVMFGGSGGNGLFDDTWEWDGNDWREVIPVMRPAARWKHSMAYDPGRGRIVLLGGEPAAGNDDIWEWTGSDWVRIPTRPLPPIGVAPMAFDSRSGALLVLRSGSTRLLGQVYLSVSLPAGAGCAGSVPNPRLRTNQALLDNRSFRLEVVQEWPSAFGVLAFSLLPGATPVAGCTWHLGALSATAPFLTNPHGVGIVQVPLPFDPHLRGAEIFAQAVLVDGAATNGFSLTNAQHIRIGDGE